MKRFSNILMLRSGDNPAQAQVQARLRFPSEVGQSRFSLRRPSAPVPLTGTLIILGVATYSRQDLGLLDDVDGWLNSGNGRPLEVEVFDVLDCGQFNDFESFIPGIGDVYQTPIVGVFIDGRLVRSAVGLHEVEEALRQHHILGPQSVAT